jgi:hypothetical protein
MRRRPLVWVLHDIITDPAFSSNRRRAAVLFANLFASRVVANSRASADAFIAAGGKAQRKRRGVSNAVRCLRRSGSRPRRQRAAQDGLDTFSELLAWTISSLFAQFGDLSNHTDYANEHAYVMSTTAGLDYLLSFARISAPGKPSVTTEAGYTTLSSVWYNGVSETVQAKYTLDTLLDAYQKGVAQTYLYELFDEPAATSPLPKSRARARRAGLPLLRQAGLLWHESVAVKLAPLDVYDELASVSIVSAHSNLGDAA